MSIWQWCFAEGLKEAFWVLQCFLNSFIFMWALVKRSELKLIKQLKKDRNTLTIEIVKCKN